jgi:hypothetical protein
MKMERLNVLGNVTLRVYFLSCFYYIVTLYLKEPILGYGRVNNLSA